MRPKGKRPAWATAANYDPGTDPWSGTATKVDPGQALIASGYAPGNRPKAQYVNYELGRDADFVSYLDTIEVRTWSAQVPIDIKTLYSSQNVLIWDPANAMYWAGGTIQSGTDDTIPVLGFSSNGVDWFDDDDALPRPPSGSQLQTYAVCASPSGILLYWDFTNGKSWFRFRTPDGTHTASANQPATIHVNAAIWDTNRWVLYGIGTQPRIWTVDLFDAWAELTLTDAAANPGGITLAATSSGGLRVAIALGSGLWYTSSLATAWTRVALSAFASTVFGLEWWEAEGVFVVVCTGGQVYTSTDAVTWTLRATVASTHFDGARSGAGGLVSLGGLIIAPCTIPVANGGTQQMLAIGIDLGRTWETIPLSIVDPAGGVGGSRAVQTIARLDNRLAIMRREGVTDGDPSRIVYGLRVR